MAIKKFQDLQVEHPQRYEVTDNAGPENLKTIKFSPGKVYQEGTKETAVIFNNIQKNGLYTVIGTRVIEGTEEIYDVELEGLEEFGIFDINLQLVANAKNTTNSPKLRILSEKYSFANNNGTISIGDIVANNIYIVKINTVKKTAFLMESDKLQKGTYPGNASDLKTEIDLKLDKGEYVGTAQSLNEGINNLEKLKLDNGGYVGNAQGLKDLSTSIWGGVYGGIIQEQGLKEVGKHYIDNINGKAYRCIKSGNWTTNTSENFEECNVQENLNKLKKFYKGTDYDSNFSYTDANVGLKIFTRIVENVSSTTPAYSYNLPFASATSYIAIPTLWHTAALDPTANAVVTCNQMSGGTCEIKTGYTYSTISVKILFIGI